MRSVKDLSISLVKQKKKLLPAQESKIRWSWQSLASAGAVCASPR